VKLCSSAAVDTSLILQNLLTPPVLFFFLGVLAVLLGSDLEIPAPLPKLFSLCSWPLASREALSCNTPAWVAPCCSPSPRQC
jgi:hypothetical protein